MAAPRHGARPPPAPPLRRAQPRPRAALHRPRAGGRRRSAEPGARLSRGRGAEVLAAGPRLPGPLPVPGRALRVSAAGERGGERAVRAVAGAGARAGAEQRGVAGHRAAARRVVIWPQLSLFSAEHVCPLFSALFSTQTRYVERIPGIVF